MDAERHLDRRSLLLAGAGLLATSLIACTGRGDKADPSATTARSGRPSGSKQTSRPSRAPTSKSPSTTPRPTPSGHSTGPTVPPPPDSKLPIPIPWAASSGDVRPEIKETAARLVEAIGTWSLGDGGSRQAARRVAALGQPGRLGRASYPPLNSSADAAALQAIKAQYGGLLTTTASVLVVCRQWHLDAQGRVVSGGTTVDVRLSKAGSRWSVTSVRPGRIRPAARPVPTLVRAVLAEPRLDLPPAARADIASGRIHDSVLTAMLRLARQYRIGVSVVQSGHPTYVFGTDRLSDHSRGRAFDTWSIDGHRVADRSTPTALVTDYMRAAAAAGSYNVGGPVQLSGGPGQFFSNAAHHDHVHAGFVS